MWETTPITDLIRLSVNRDMLLVLSLVKRAWNCSHKDTGPTNAFMHYPVDLK